MEPLSVAASIIAVLQLSEAVLGSCYRFVGKVKDAAFDIDRVIRQIGYLTTILRDLKCLIEPNESLSSAQVSSNCLKSLTGDHGPLAVCTRSLENLKSKLPNGPVTFRQMLQWPFESKKIHEIVDRITAQIPILELALVGDSYGVIVAIKASLEDAKRRDEREKVLDWLRAVDPTVKHLASRGLHQPGSNHWIIESEHFKEWRDNADQTLWLYGIPGAGKTIICSTIIEHIEGLCKVKPESRLAYYYFDFSDQDLQKLDTVLRCLIWQLCRHDECLPIAAWVLYESCDNGRKQPSDTVLANTFFDLLSEEPARQNFIIFDALDEYPIESREYFFELVLGRIEKRDQAGSYNFLFTSRKELDIEKRITELNVKLHIVPILTGDVDADVRLHVTQFITTHRTMKDWSKDLKTEIEDVISDGAQGMFRWAVCQLELIKNCRQAGAVRKTLKNLPKTLDDTYDRILASIPDETWQIARTALMLLTHSIRPLTLIELAEAMVIDYENQCFDPNKHRLTNYHHVLEICSSLVSVSTIKLNAYTTPWLAQKYNIERNFVRFYSKKPLETVQFAHFSVKEYMTLERAKTVPKVTRFSFSPTVAHLAIAELSLVYLLDFSGGVRLTQIDFEAFPFLAYAAQHWPEHWRWQLALKDQETIDGLIQRILDTGENHCNYINYINICQPDAFIEQKYSRGFAFMGNQARSLDSIVQPLYYAAQLGHLQLCQWLLDERGCDVNSVRGTFGQAIHIAARFGHKNVVQLLLNRGARVDQLCGEYSYPLQAAAYGGYVDIVKLLLDRGAAVNAAGGKYGSALIAACDQGHLDTAKVLLDRGAAMDIVCVYEGKALKIAARTGNKALVQLLLQKGADINDVCAGEGSALCSSVLSGDLEMVKMLVAAGADVNLRPGDKCPPLMVACSNPDRQKEGDGRRYVEIAKFLLMNGADPNTHSGEYGDALQAAVVGSAKGNVEEDNNIDIVKLLLDHGVDINHCGGSYYSSMRACVYCGNIAAALLLIERGVELDDEIFLLAVEGKRKTIIPRLFKKGVDVNAQNESGTALQLAIKNSDETTTNILLSHPDIDVNTLGKTDEGITALSMAVGQENEDIVKQLLNLGADVNQPSNGSTCLTAAVFRENLEMVKLLLDHGADINTNLPCTISALMVACCKQNEALVQFLLDHGADVNLWVLGEGDAIQQAAFKGNGSIVKLLLAHGADVKAPEGKNGSCLECAIAAKKPALTRLLLDAGANVNFSGTLEDLRERNCGFGGSLSGSIRCKQDGLTQLLIERGANVNWPGRQYCGSPLQEAVKADDEDAVKLLLEHGADVNLVGGYHGSPLTCAILEHREQETCNKYMRLLLDAGGNVNLQCGEQFGCPLGAAVCKGHISVVENLLDLGADVNVPAGSFGSPLHLAVVEGDLDIFRLLLSRGADPNFTSGDCEIPLAAAAWHSRNMMLKELLDHGADPNLGDSTAVVSAASAGNNEGMLMLIEHGANIHIQEGVPGKALHEAARNTNIDMVELLLDRGVDVNAFGGKYGNALMAILGRDYVRNNQIGPMVEILLDAGASVNSQPSENYTSALQAAIEGSNHGFVDRLLAGADVNAHDPRFGTVLSAAARYGRLETMKKLVERGADPNFSGEKYGSSLQAAARSHKFAAVEYLLSLGVDVNQLSGKTGYALHAACRRESGDGSNVIKLLLDHGADPNGRGGKYETALQSAAKHGNLENVKILLGARAEPTIEGGRYGSPLKAAMAKKKHYHVANFLRRYIASRQDLGTRIGE